MSEQDSLFNFERPDPARAAVSVSDLVNRARRAVEAALPLMWVEGEISGLKRAASGHSYFALKDENAQVACVLYRQKSARVPVALRDGMAVQLRVLASFYTPRGEFQLQVEEVRLAGVGALYAAFAALKAKLQEEGLFDAARKRALPQFPKTVGVVTSRSGAVIHDIVTTLRNRWPSVQIILYPALVQGNDAPESIVRAITTANARNETDVLIVGRGGGSMEDLWAFNDESVARALAASSIPTVSAVGHESDFTIADFVADVRAPTPTYAATLVVPDVREWQQRIDGIHAELRAVLAYEIREKSHTLAALRARLKDPINEVRAQRARLLQLSQRLQRTGGVAAKTMALDALRARLLRTRPSPSAAREGVQQYASRLQRAMQSSIGGCVEKLAHAQHTLALVAPQRVLERGFVWVKTSPSGHFVGSAAQLRAGDAVALVFKDGEVDAEVKRAATQRDPKSSGSPT
jgi:exodeoxyribonuclease VII large subunit